MQEKLGIENTEKVVMLLAGIIDHYKDATEDGKVTYTEILGFSQFIVQGLMLRDELQEVPSEFADLSEEEAEYLVEKVSIRLGLDNDIAEEIAVKLLDIVSDGYAVAKLLKAKAA